MPPGPSHVLLRHAPPVRPDGLAGRPPRSKSPLPEASADELDDPGVSVATAARTTDMAWSAKPSRLWSRRRRSSSARSRSSRKKNRSIAEREGTPENRPWALVAWSARASTDMNRQRASPAGGHCGADLSAKFLASIPRDPIRASWRLPCLSCNAPWSSASECWDPTTFTPRAASATWRPCYTPKASWRLLALSTSAPWPSRSVRWGTAID